MPAPPDSARVHRLIGVPERRLRREWDMYSSRRRLTHMIPAAGRRRITGWPGHGVPCPVRGGFAVQCGMDSFAPGDLAVLASPLGQELLHSTIPARVAYVANGGEPRVVPLVFHWDGTEMVFGVFAGSPKLRHLKTGDRVAVTVDTQSFPFAALQVRGRITVTPLAGVVPEYRLAVARYLGAEEGAAFVAGIDPPPVMTRIALRPSWARGMDMRGP